MRVTRIFIPADNEIAKCIQISANFRAHAYNLKKDLKYLRNNFNNGIKPYAIQWAKEHSLARFEAMIINYPEYKNHPDLIKAQALYNELSSLINK